MVKTKIALLISGGGTNLQALIDAQKAGVLRHGRIALVVSSNSIAYGLKRAEEAGIETAVVTKKGAGSQQAFEQGILDELEKHGIETETAWIGVKPVRGCIACNACRNKPGACAFDDDVCNRISEKLAGADALVIGSPVYYGQPNGALLAVVQRMFYSNGRAVKGKAKIGSAYYYFHKTAAYMLKKKMITVGKHVFYASKSGKLLTNRFKTFNSAKNGKRVYYFGEDGEALLGLQEIDGKKYFFYREKNRLGIMAVNTTITSQHGNHYDNM